MKLLRNPVVVGVLAVVAVAFVVHALLPVMHRGGSTGAPADPGAVASVPASDTSAAGPQPVSRSGGPVEISHADWTSVSNRYAGDVDSSPRDPFHMRDDVTNEISDTQLLLILNAIWKSSSSTLAVINNHVVSNGDKIQNYQVETIEADRVWVLGPNGREEIHFKSVNPASPSSTAGRSAGPVPK